MTKAVLFHQFGGPEVLEIEDIPTPRPGMGEVRLKMHAVGLNRADSMLYRGVSSRQAHLPSLVGCEGAGTVEAVGPGADQAWLGKKVAMLPTSITGQYGTLGEQVIAPVASLVGYPEGFSDSECSGIWLQYLTAYVGLIEVAHVGARDFLVITSASSNLGIALLQVARKERTSTIAVIRDGRWKRELLKMGADYVIASDEEDLEPRIQEITKGRGPRIVFSAMSEPPLATVIPLMEPGGILLESEDLVELGRKSPIRATVPASITVRKCQAEEVADDPGRLASAIRYICEGLKFGHLQVDIARKFPFPQVSEAYRCLESNETLGKIVVTFPNP
ncbi:zinc-dependent alcohol dehydrogenase family protein [Granulicella sp. S156]|uniref:zinc-dependent alcohol dehydrogenase family protein n=1 Tax=Granulicella sp. S156 TaxID=1747224 RepID=UPI00131EBFCF|nr:zinc-dependent alcohol dehydrogenase family protein [Granulicella sp. S156]